MNIAVKTCDGHILVRLDTTWEKDNEDFYPPEFVDSLTYSPVIFARVQKPGRSISQKFASRYYDAVNFGVLLYPENLNDGSPAGLAQASCLDHTSFLPTPLFQPLTIGQKDNSFELRKSSRKVYSIGGEDITLETIENAIVECTKYIYIRTGDFIAVELTDRKPLAVRSDGTVAITGTWCGNDTINFKIIF
jgi:hypothetical protein